MGRLFDKLIKTLPEGIDQSYIEQIKSNLSDDELDAMCILGDEQIEGGLEDI